MCTCDRRHFVLGSLLSMGVTGLAASALAQTPDGAKKLWVCPPCGCDMDGKPLPEPGVCQAPGCGMPLIEYKPPANNNGSAPKPPAAPAPAPKTPVPTP